LVVTGGIVLAYRGLLGFDPYRAVPTDLRGIEGALFDPVPSTPAFVLVVFLWKLVENQHRLRRALAGPGSPLAAALPFALSFALYGWAAYTRADELLLPSLSLFLIGSGLALGGTRAVDWLLAPALIVLFAAPIPATLLNHVMFELQLVTAALATAITDLLGEASRSGDLIFHGDQVFQVIESCAGLATLSTLTLTSFIIPTSIRRRRIHSVLLVLSAPFVSFAINTGRVLTIMANPLSYIGSVHTAQGILMLVVGILALAGIDRALGRALGPAAPPALPIAATGPGLRSLSSRYALAGLSLVLVAADLFLPRFEGERIAHPTFRELRTLAAKGLAVEIDDDFLGTVAFTQSASTRYEVDGRHVDVFIGVNNRTIRHNSALSPKTELPGAGWVGEERTTVREASSREVTELVASSPPDRPGGERSRALIHHFVTGAGSIARETLRALLALDESPWRKTDRQIVVRLVTPLEEGEPARRAARERLREMGAQVERNLSREISSSPRTPPALSGQADPAEREAGI
jgi:exosortase/archaeosortase family protein